MGRCGRFLFLLVSLPVFVGCRVVLIWWWMGVFMVIILYSSHNCPEYFDGYLVSMLVGISLTSCSLVIDLGILSCAPLFFDNCLGGDMVIRGWLINGILVCFCGLILVFILIIGSVCYVSGRCFCWFMLLMPGSLD